MSGPAVARRILTGTSTAAFPVALAFGVVVGLLVVVGAPPFEALRDIWTGSMGGGSQIGDTLMAWVPLTLGGAGLVVTFAAGLWNIGIEGQIAAGGIAATWVGRTAPGGAPVLIPLMFLGGAIGGILWALLAGVLKTKGRVNEIFGGLGLDFVASGLAVYLIIGPWKRHGIASTSGTALLRPAASLPVIGQTRLSLVAVVVAAAALAVVYFLMREESRDKVPALLEYWGATKTRAIPVYGDLRSSKLGVSKPDLSSFMLLQQLWPSAKKAWKA